MQARLHYPRVGGDPPRHPAEHRPRQGSDVTDAVDRGEVRRQVVQVRDNPPDLAEALLYAFGVSSLPSASRMTTFITHWNWSLVSAS